MASVKITECSHSPVGRQRPPPTPGAYYKNKKRMIEMKEKLTASFQKIIWLYEQGASKERVGAYLRRWLGWANIGAMMGVVLMAGVVWGRDVVVELGDMEAGAYRIEWYNSEGMIATRREELFREEYYCGVEGGVVMVKWYVGGKRHLMSMVKLKTGAGVGENRYELVMKCKQIRVEEYGWMRCGEKRGNSVCVCVKWDMGVDAGTL